MSYLLVEVSKGSEKDPRPMPRTGGELQNNGNGWNGSEKHYQ
ncbi:MAG: hypothetical protein WDN26_18290 [Chitinophagaceae bacterium]